MRRQGLRGIRGLPVAFATHGFAREGRRVAVPKETPLPSTGGGPGSIPSATKFIVTPDRECLGQFPGASFPPAGIVELPCGRTPSGTRLPVMASRPGKGPSPATPPTGNMPAIAAALQTAPRPGPWRQPRPPGRGPSGVGSSQGGAWLSVKARFALIEPACGIAQEHRRHAGEVGSPSGLPAQNSGKLCR